MSLTAYKVARAQVSKSGVQVAYCIMLIRQGQGLFFFTDKQQFLKLNFSLLHTLALFIQWVGLVVLQVLCGDFGAVGFLGVVFANVSGGLWMFRLYKNVYIYNLV